MRSVENARAWTNIMESDNGRWLLFGVTVNPYVDSLYLFATKLKIMNRREHGIAAYYLSYTAFITTYICIYSRCDTVVIRVCAKTITGFYYFTFPIISSCLTQEGESGIKGSVEEN